MHHNNYQGKIILKRAVSRHGFIIDPDKVFYFVKIPCPQTRQHLAFRLFLYRTDALRHVFFLCVIRLRKVNGNGIAHFQNITEPLKKP